MTYDYSNAPPDLIPKGTRVAIIMHIRAGGVGEDGMCKRSEKGAEMLDNEFTVLDGEYAKRKWWENWILDGPDDGHKQMAIRYRRMLKLILDSALGLDPDDMTPQARVARTVSLKRFDGMCFIAEIGIKKGDGDWPDKNVITRIITKGGQDWRPVQPPPFDGGGSAGSAAAPPQSVPPQPESPVSRPGWAQS